MSFNYTSLITDRTESDVGADELRGSYDWRAFNRVTAAMEDLEARFTALGYLTGYKHVEITHLDGTVSTAWREDDEDIRMDKIEAYRSNVAALRQALTLVESTPQAPEDMDLLTVEEANAIERILVNIDETLIRMATTFVSCPWFPVLGRRWPLYSDDSGKIQFTENVNGGNAYRSKSIPFSRKEKQAPSRAAMESIGICVPSIMSRRFSLQRNFRTIPLVVLYAPPAFRLSGRKYVIVTSGCWGMSSRRSRSFSLSSALTDSSNSAFWSVRRVVS